MAAYDEPSGDFKAISNGAKKSPEFRKMTGAPKDDESEGGDEVTALGEAYDAAQAEDRDAFSASMLAAIKSCIANYGSKK